jgi:hypothetical protein
MGWMNGVVRGGDDVAPRVRIAAAAALVASGLLAAGTGASLALAAPEPGDGGASGPQSGGSAPGAGEPAPATMGAPVPGGAVAAPGSVDRGAKPNSQVGDGRNGLAAGSTATTAPATNTVPTTAAPHTTEVAPTTISTEPSGKLSEAGSTSAPQTIGVTRSEEGQESASRLANGTEATGEFVPAAAGPGETTTSAAGPTTTPPATGEGTKDGDGTKPPDEGEHHPGFGWPWSWWLGCSPLSLPPGSIGGSDGTRVPPAWKPPLPPAMQLPIPYIPREIVPELPGIIEPLLDAVTGLATAASEVPFAPITLPVIVIPSFPAATGAGGGGGAGGPGVVPRPGIPAAPKPPASTNGGGASKPPAQSGRQQESPPAFSAGNQALPAPSYRMGYMEYLRAAGFGQIAAVAVPGLSGILILTSAGGLIGYRQARAGRSVRIESMARFMG